MKWLRQRSYREQRLLWAAWNLLGMAMMLIPPFDWALLCFCPWWLANSWVTPGFARLWSEWQAQR